MKPVAALVALACLAASAACVPGENPGLRTAATTPSPAPPSPAPPSPASSAPAASLPVAPPLPPEPRRVAGAGNADARFARALDQFAGACGALQAYVVGVQLFGSEKRRGVVEKAATVLDALCSDPPRDVETAVARASDVFAAIQATRARR